MLSVNNKTKKKAPKGPFSDIAKHILGPDYDLSLVFIGSTLSRRLNRERRDKDHVANILSFPYSENEGEIFIDLGKTEKEAPKFGHSFNKHLIFLFIHGCLHLEGLDHGDKMESEEQRILKRFSK